MHCVCEMLAPTLRELARHDKNLTDQLRRAATSVVLNLAEGNGSVDGRRTNHYRIAQGSLYETRSALRLARTWGYANTTVELDAKLDRVGAMLYRLTNRRS